MFRELAGRPLFGNALQALCRGRPAHAHACGPAPAEVPGLPPAAATDPDTCNNDSLFGLVSERPGPVNPGGALNAHDTSLRAATPGGAPRGDLSPRTGRAVSMPHERRHTSILPFLNHLRFSVSATFLSGTYPVILNRLTREQIKDSFQSVCLQEGLVPSQQSNVG